MSLSSGYRQLVSNDTNGLQTGDSLMTVDVKPQGRDLFENPLGTDGFEFVEFTSPEPERLKGLFEMMGFAAVSKHRSKNVLRFRQGDINFLLTMEASGQPADFRQV